MNGHPIVAFAREVLRFPLRPRQAAILDEIYSDDIRTAVLRLGRRSGKGRIAAVVATYEGTANAPAHVAIVPAGEQVAIVVVATSQRQARVVHRYIGAFLRGSPDLAKLIVRDTLDEIELSNGVVIITLPSHAASARGPAVAVVILDEAAHFTGKDGSPLDVAELWDALVPATLDFPAAKVLVTSTPRWSTGWFAELCARAASGRFADMRHFHATTAQMREGEPRVVAFLEQERAKDPSSFAREYEAEFDSGIGAVFDADVVRDAVREGPDDRPPVAGLAYLVSIDAAFVGDRFAVAVGHLEFTGPNMARTIVDRAFGWRGSRTDPVRLDPTLDALAQLSAAYGGAPIVIDQASAQAIRQGLEARGVTVLERPWSSQSKVDAVGATRQALYAGALELPPHRELVAELTSLEQRPTPGGRPRIAAPGGGSDDYATAVMALVAELHTSVQAPAVFLDLDRYEQLVGRGVPAHVAEQLAATDVEPGLVSISPI